MSCSAVQTPAQSCVSCHAELAKYFCQVCKFWDNDPNKSIFHCFDCGMCRVGKGLGIDYFHCDKCNICLAMSMKGNHKCIERNLECDCPICGDFLFTSTATVIFMVCCIFNIIAGGTNTHIETALRTLDPLQMPSRVHSNVLPVSNMFQVFDRHERLLSTH